MKRMKFASIGTHLSYHSVIGTLFFAAAIAVCLLFGSEAGFIAALFPLALITYSESLRQVKCFRARRRGASQKETPRPDPETPSLSALIPKDDERLH